MKSVRTNCLQLSKGRMSFVNNLHSEDAVYHDTCSQYFRLGKPLPKRFAASSSPANSQRKGRIFEEVVSHLEDNEDNQVTSR